MIEQGINTLRTPNTASITPQCFDQYHSLPSDKYLKTLLISNWKSFRIVILIEMAEQGASTSNQHLTTEEQWALKRLALKQAKQKAQVEERQARKNMKEQEKMVFRVHPRKDFIAKYFLRERTDHMVENGLWYKYNVPEDHSNPEVTLQLWKKEEETGEMVLLGDVGDVYSLVLDLPSCSMNINVIVESREVRMREDLGLYYSVFEFGFQDKAYTIFAQAWFNYLLYVEEDHKVELDTRIMFQACGNKIWLGEMSYTQFKTGSRSDFAMLLQSMEPGEVYPRPSVEEAMLATADEPTTSGYEVLRMDGHHRDFRTKMKRERMAKRKPSPLPNVSPYDTTLHRGPPAPKKTRSNTAPNYTLPRAAQQLILDCINPWSEEMIETRLLNRACRSLLHEDAWSIRRSSRDASPATLKSWSGSGWTTGNSTPVSTPDHPSTLSDAEFPPTDDSLNNALVATPDQTLVSLKSSISEIEILAVSLEVFEDAIEDVLELSVVEVDAEGNPLEGPEEDVNNHTGELSISFTDSVDVFLAKQRNESQIVTVSSEDSVVSSPMTEFGSFTPESSLLEDDGDDEDIKLLNTFMAR